MTSTLDQTSVSEALLADFDELRDAGKTLSLQQLKDRYAASKYFRHRDFQLYHRVIELPVTVGMIAGDEGESVRKVISGLREIHGDELIFSFDHRAFGDVVLLAHVWRSEPELRELWAEFAEHEYKDLLGGELK